MIILKIKILLNLVIIFILICSSTPVLAYEEENSNDEEALSIIESLEASSTVSNEPDVNSTHIVAIDRSTERILYEKSAFDKTPMASTTKILTAIIAIENCKLDDLVCISSKAAHTSGSTLGITTDDKMKMEDLLYGLMLRSGNDCAVAIAEHIGGSVDGFSNIMNNKIKELGLNSSNFITPHGLDHPDHYTTAYELALITNYALKNETFLKIVSTKETTICNRNKTNY